MKVAGPLLSETAQTAQKARHAFAMLKERHDDLNAEIGRARARAEQTQQLLLRIEAAIRRGPFQSRP